MSPGGKITPSGEPLGYRLGLYHPKKISRSNKNEETVAGLLHNIKRPVLDLTYKVKYSYHADNHMQRNMLRQTNNNVNERITCTNTFLGGITGACTNASLDLIRILKIFIY